MNIIEKPKISIVFFSPPSGRGWKGARLAQLISSLKAAGMFNAFYGFSLETCGNESAESGMNFSATAINAYRVVNKLSSLFGFSDLARVVGYHLLGKAFLSKVLNDGSDIVLMQLWPSFLVDALKKAGKRVILEADMAHPRYVSRVMAEEYRELGGVPQKYWAPFNTEKYVADAEKSISAADKIICFSEFSRDSFLAEGVEISKLVVIPPISSISFKRSSTTKEFAFLSCGKLTVRKGTHHLLECWREANIRNAKLILIGKIQPDLKIYLKTVPPINNVIFLGEVDALSIYEKFNGVGILLSLAEGLPRAILEQMARSMPVIVSPAAAGKIVKDGVGGFVVDPHDKARIVTLMRQLNDDRQKTTQMGGLAQEALRDSAARFYPDVIIDVAMSI